MGILRRIFLSYLCNCISTLRRFRVNWSSGDQERFLPCHPLDPALLLLIYKLSAYVSSKKGNNKVC